jgi:hypothetical protein
MYFSPKTIFKYLRLIGLLGIVDYAGAAQIIIKAEATREYSKQVATRNPDEPLTYHFIKGDFFPGYISDPSLGKVDFMDIAQNLAIQLTKQNYYPSKDIENNDVMIIVNWGITAVEEDLMEMSGITSMEEYETIYGLGDSNDETVAQQLELFGPTAVAKPGAADRRKTSRLLGFAETLDSTNVMPQDLYELDSALNRERYFFVVLAYDYQKFKNEKEMKLLWITRFSIQATGTNFEDAYKELTFAASDYFGKNMKGLQKKRTDDDSKVEMGEIEVLETVPEN